MNQGETGPAMAGPNGLGNKSYANVYNQRNNKSCLHLTYKAVVRWIYSIVIYL